MAEAPPALVLTASPRLKETPLPSSVPTTADLRAFEALERDVDARYPDVERVFRDVGLAECRTNVREATVETHDGVLLSFKTSRLIPFSVSCINETAIRIARASYPEGPGRVRVVQMRCSLCVSIHILTVRICPRRLSGAGAGPCRSRSSSKSATS